MRDMHLFAGGGGGLYASLILGHTPVVAVEWEAYCCDVLRARKEEGWWPDCEIIEGDIRAFSGERYAGKVDCIHAGFPCQDLSVAGGRAGLDGDRSSLYIEAIRIFCEVRPRYLFLENVPGILSANGGGALNRVMSDLAEIGCDARWTCLRASDVGANHRRDRWWCLATRRDADTHNGHEFENEAICTRGNSVEFGGAGAAYSGSEGLHKRWHPKQPCTGSGFVGRIQRDGIPGGIEEENKDMEDSERIPNANGERRSGGGRQQPTQESSARRSECFWAIEPPVGRVANGVANRVHRLKALGNGQVPLQAAYAWVMLGGPVGEGIL